MIVYAVICRSNDASILCEYSTDELTGNAPQCTAALLEHLRDHPNILKEGDLRTFRQKSRTSGGGEKEEENFLSQFIQACTVPVMTAEEMDLSSVDEYFFHLWHEKDVFYCCLGDDKDQRQQKVNFAFLKAISRDFAAKYSKRRIKNANSYSLDKDFKSILRSTMHHYNIERNQMIREENSQIDHLRAQVEDLTIVMGRNLNLLLDRGMHIDSLMDKASQARRDSMVFKKRTVKVKKSMEMKAYKMWFLICFSIAIFVYFILLSACGFRFESCRDSSGGGD